MDNNKVELLGKIMSNFKYDHSINSENFYTTVMDVERSSGNHDYVILMVSDHEIYVDEDLTDRYVSVTGTLRTHNIKDENNDAVHLKILVYVDTLDLVDMTGDCIGNNYIHIVGNICKIKPIRKTPFGRTICDLIVAVNRPYSKSDYIPCICWGNNADKISEYKVGASVDISGRIQSRTYSKGDEEKIAYELSVQTIG